MLLESFFIFRGCFGSIWILPGPELAISGLIFVFIQVKINFDELIAVNWAIYRILSFEGQILIRHQSPAVGCPIRNILKAVGGLHFLESAVQIVFSGIPEKVFLESFTKCHFVVTGLVNGKSGPLFENILIQRH